MKHNEFVQLYKKAKSNHETQKNIEKLGGIHTKIVQSDKVGYDWLETYIGKQLISKEYIEQVNPQGTQENPIEFKKGVTLIPNAYYLYKKSLYVYMGVSGTANKWIADDFEEI